MTAKINAGERTAILAYLGQDKSNEWIQKKIKVRRQQVAAVKAHIKMGTYGMSAPQKRKAPLKRPSYQVSAKKQEIREILANAVPDYGKVITFAGAKLRDAKEYAGKKHATVISIEQEKKVYEDQLKEGSKYPSILPLHCKALDAFACFKTLGLPQVDLVYLDFCGPYARKYEKTFLLALERIKDGGLIALTFLLARDSSKEIAQTRLCQLLEGREKEFEKNRVGCLKGGLITLASEQGTKLLCLEDMQYKNEDSTGKCQTSSPMLFLLYRKEDKKKRKRSNRITRIA